MSFSIMPVAPPRPSRLSRVMNAIDQAHQVNPQTHNGSSTKIRQRNTPQYASSVQTPLSMISHETQATIVDRIDFTLNKHYYTIAYGLVLSAYLIGFIEYLYFRLVSLIDPLPIDPSRKNDPNRQGKEGFHYGVSLAAFIAIGMFQLLCFFGLTISDSWTHCIPDPSKPELSRQRKELGDFIRLMIGKTMYRVFSCYGICSIINCLIIYYMVGIRDSLGDVLSIVLCYIFDAVVILYFIAFPITTIIYHPHVQCCKSANPSPIIFDRDPRSQSSTLDTVISHINVPSVKHQNLEIQSSAEMAFSRNDPRRRPLEQRQFDANIPVLEQYLQSPKRIAPKSTVV
ncbi:hypothetical protein WR25_12232 [Diploscapter pachys]|uniref:Uncharacterized protein n=1 Tax=Diploscapter pachys TaxID=2018661 RepID=A0A2A2KC98_9BILA|nr:hypothetical protein WR25_12232 [Diploscapter pachys]